MDLQLQGKTALVTGANRGTGNIIAAHLAAEGVQVYLHAPKQAEAENASATLTGSVPVWGELDCDRGCDQLLEQCEQLRITPDILINNYGAAASGRWGKCTSEQWREMYETNVLSASRIIEGQMPVIKARSWGRIILLGTIGSHQPGLQMPHYYAAKGALATMAAGLCQALGGTGTTVNTVSPGLIHTEEIEAYYRKLAAKKGWGEDWNTILEKLTASEYPNPCRRIAKREEVADLVTFLASPRADFINGQNIRVDGGAVNYV